MKGFSKFRVWLFSFLSGMNFTLIVYNLLANNLLLVALAVFGFLLTSFTVWAEFASAEI